MTKTKVLVLATGLKTRGGITSVLKVHSTMNFWKKWNCIWIETHNDKSGFYKLYYFITALFKFIIEIPSASIVHMHISWRVSLLRKTPFIIISYMLRKKIIYIFMQALRRLTSSHLDYIVLFLN